MVVARAARPHNSSTVKDIWSSSSLAMTQRVSELPSLSFRERFGITTPTPPQASSGPLRVTVRVAPTPVAPPRRFSTRYTRSYTDDLSVATSLESRGSSRRVRFELPPPSPPSPLHACGAPPLLSTSGGPSRQQHQQQQQQQQQPPPLQVAGVDSWLRSRLVTAAAGYNTTFPTSTLSHSTPRAAATPASRVHDTGRYRRGTLPQAIRNVLPGAASRVPPPGAAAILRAAKEADEKGLLRVLQDEDRRVTAEEVNATDVSGMTASCHAASHGSLAMLEALLEIPGVDVNRGDNDGNTPLHYAAQAGHADIVNFILTHCTGVNVDARNDAGLTPLMKAALQGRNRCAKLLIIGGASPALKDGGKGFRPDEWARHCGRYVCSEIIMKMTRHYYTPEWSRGGRWASEPDLHKDVPGSNPKLVHQSPSTNSFTNKLKHALWMKGKAANPSSSLVAHLTTAALCASSPVVPAHMTLTCKTPGVRSPVRPLVVPRLLVTPVASDAADASSSGAACVVAAAVPATEASRARSQIGRTASKYSRRLYFKKAK